MSTCVAVSLESIALALARSASDRDRGFESMAAGNDPGETSLVDGLRNAIGQLAGRPPREGILDSVDDRTISLAQSFLAEHGMSLGAEVAPVGDGFEAKFDKLDPGWIWSLREWTLALDKHPFVDASDDIPAIADDYRIALLSDWGTGLYGAPVCAASIQATPCDMVLHLGDVYYAGTEREVESRFIEHWPEHASAVSRALNGNHEMYSGGDAYFERILKHERFGQTASHFAVHNAHWLLVGLDTAYVEHDLHGGQLQWLTRLAERFPQHRILLFSHHQPFSAFEGQGHHLVHKLSPLLNAGRIAAWYWGHEHSCVRYDMHPKWQLLGRCVGHSGFAYPRLVPDGPRDVQRWIAFDAKLGRPGGLVLDGPNEFIAPRPLAYGPNGYVTLELRGARVHESYRDPTGRVIGEFEFGQ